MNTCIIRRKIIFGLFILIFSVFYSATADSAVYYISSNGNDSNSGLSTSAPWQTISKVNAMSNSFAAGDQILFRKGDSFFGELKITKGGVSGSNIVFGSYGTGEPAEFTGIKLVTGWSVYSGNIYRAVLTDTASAVYIDNKLQTIARYPNSGFLRIDNGGGTTGFSDAALTESSGYWIGANCRVRTVNWTYETKTVSAFSAGNVTFSSATSYATNANYGYYLDNKLALLDSPGEWFQDKANGFIYLYTPGGVNPNSLQIEAAVIKNGITTTLSRHYITIQDLKISGYREFGMDIYTNNYITVQRCFVSRTGKFGIRMNGNYNLLDNNVLEDNLNSAVTGNFATGIIRNNKITRTGLVAGYGENTWGYMALQLFLGAGATVENNIIDSTGYTGLSCGKNMIVRNNVIRYSCLTLNDGAGIDFDDADGIQILNNIVNYTYGNTESSNSTAKYAMGIYFGASLTKNVLVQGNTLANNNYAGINVDNKNTSVNNVITGNVLYNNAYTQIVFTDISAGSTYTPVYGNTVTGNIFYCLNAQQTCMEQQMFNSPSFSDFGTFDSNYYCNPYTEYVLRKSMVYGTYSTKYYRLSSWKSKFGEDPHSNYSQFSFDQYKVTSNITGNLITNSRFISTVSPWSTTPSAGSTATYAVNPLLDTGCLKITWNGNGGPESMTSSNYVNIVKGNYYSVSFSCAGNYTGDFSTFGRPVAGGNPFLYARRYFAYENFRRNYGFIFRADTSDASTRVAFALSVPDSLLYIDNVSLYQVNVERIDSSYLSKLFLNETGITKMISLNGINYKNPDGSLVTGSISLPPFSSRILINDNSVSYKTLSLKTLIEGFYDSVNNILVKDTVRVDLRSSSSPYAIVDSAKCLTDSAGNGNYSFSSALNNTGYYVVVKHRNTIETWSSVPVSFTDFLADYDFTNSVSKAYGNNLVQKGSKFCIYSGDPNHDNSVDGGDLSLVENDIHNSVTGYVSTDLDGDGSVDSGDLSIVENNVFKSVASVRP